MDTTLQALPQVTGILLAAGFSRRFGSADKLMQPMADGVPMAVAAASNMQAVLPVSVAVVREDNPLLAQALQTLGMQVVLCDAQATEMADSLRLGIHHAAQRPAGTAGYVIALADMPFIQPKTIYAVASSVLQGAWIAQPVYREQPGHPVGFASLLTPALLAVHGDQGARAVIRQYAAQLQRLASDDAGILRDIDTASDWQAALAAAAGQR